ncbi:uncharacterized protein TRAVEDRAFT_149253 [Trametes versicolor FP-101664 SS1]|uniref:uncharacterized protein n=1 Tax=Trametes versicolor (strain FP-101664) TaxID=717944 RepID=UPI0004623BC4|nr:uncharacterized protein TRAVEDRAFT_149253 [Trametes versicolor FP-101664 SS1]EIW58815.1 hypothetical protein TRAVEDRAFT_149253 [Trametes versicolor FP-101664 SS1]
MVNFSTSLVLALSAIAVSAVPLEKRIAQTISASTQKWVAACNAAGGADQCSNISVTAFSTLLAAAGPCDQQNSADAMITLAKTLNNDPDMIKFAQIFAQQPRNTPTSESVQYCQQAPKNAELNGLFQCQFQGAKATTFVGGVAVGAAGTIPFGQTTPLSPAGSCPANPTGPIPDGQQLSDITQDPGLANVKGGSSAAAPPAASSVAAAPPAASSAAPPAATTAVASSAAAAPPASTCAVKKRRGAMKKRIAQDTVASATPWEDACTKAGGADKCNPIAVTAFSTLLAAADPCAQQDSADAMVDLAKQLNNDADMIRLAQIFAQQPRNTPTSQAVVYCQKAPKNAELQGLFQCQFQGASQATFVGGLAVGAPGTIPFGLTAPVSPAGSCPANPAGPIPDGQQLVDITQQPKATGGAAAAGGDNSATGGAVDCAED